MESPTNSNAGFRLSPQQERIWTQQGDNADRYLTQAEILLEGPLDVAKLRQAVQDAVTRHEILRTVFHRQAGLKIPFQVIRPEPAFSWTPNCSETPELNLEQGPALSACLTLFDPETHTLRLRLPALCADLQSMQNLIAEIGSSYAGKFDKTGEVLQYADIVEWQEELLTSDDTKPGRDFWRDHCRQLDFASWNAMLSPFETNAGAPFKPGVHEIQTPRSSHQDALTEEFLLACCQIFLSRITNQSTVAIGCQVNGRPYEELRDAIGLFVKYLPLQVVVDPEIPFRVFLHQTENSLAEVRNWQQSFAWTHADSPPGIEQPIAFDYEDLPPGETYGGVKFSVTHQKSCCERFEIKLSASKKAGSLILKFHYDTGRLDPETIHRWSRSFITLMAAAAEHPETPVSRLPLLSEADRHQVLVQWNQTSAPYSQGHCVHDLFETQAALTPDRIAVQYQDATLSYRELNERANQLAHTLRRMGVEPDAPVGLCMERSLDMVVALLAILKAGGAYVPLSADHPKPRLRQQLQGAVALITEEKFLPRMPEFAGTTFCLDRDHAAWSTESRSNPELRTHPENLAYVIYTSGSTGIPKGVAVRHRNLVNYTSFINRLLDLEKYPGGLHFATISTLSADLGNTCIYPSLLSGGHLHVIPHEIAADGQRLCDYTRQFPIDVLKIVPSHLAALLDSGDAKELLPKRYLIIGGESLSRPLVERIKALAGSCEIINHYGPTETTVGSLTLRLTDHDWKRTSDERIPIGRPISNTKIYILDAHRQPVPIGISGELYIGGAGVAAGYISDPELTAERFLPDPFSSDPDAKMYRTGDLTRYLPDGNVEFLGRADDQVKIRGFRIEPGEIESTLSRHPTVKRAVIVAGDDERGEKRLLAYVVPRQETAVTADELRTHLKAELPDYMVPAAIILLAKIPLTANGKIDRSALPPPVPAYGTGSLHAAPTTPAEEIVGAIWAEVLHREHVGVEENFFDIGGHSLLATQIASRLRKHFHIPVAVRTLFEFPTISGLAKQMDQTRRAEHGLLPPPIVKILRDRPLQLSFAQERLWVLHQMEPDSPLYNVPRRMRLKGALNIEALKKSLDEIVRRHESQRTTFGVLDGHPVQIIAPALAIPLPLVNLSTLPEAERETEARRIASEEAAQPFGLEQGPLVRAQLVQLAAQDYVLLFTMHHIISDAWSAGVFFQELSTLYEAFSSGRPSPLPELVAQYADYAAHEREWLQGAVLRKHIDYWREHLSGAPPLLELPFDRPPQPVRSYRGTYERVSLDPEVTAAVKAFSRKQGSTLFMTLLAAFQILLSRYSRRQQIVIGTDNANRTTAETERMIGFFINLLPVRTDLSGNPTFRELLERVRETLLESYAHMDLPFDKLVEELNPQRSAIHNPIVQVLFVMQNTPRFKRELARLQLVEFDAPLTTSKFDLALFMGERNNELFGNWVYSIDLFDQSTILRMAKHFETLLRSAMAQPDARLSELEMLSEEEKLQQGEEKTRRKQALSQKLKSTVPESVGLLPTTGGEE